MMQRAIIAAAALALFAVKPVAAAQTPSPTAPAVTPSPALSPDDAVAARAREWLGRLQKQPPDIDRAQLTQALSQAYDDVTLKAMGAQVANLGAPKDFRAGRTFALADGSIAHVYRVTWEQGSLDFLFALDPSGKISAMYFRPA